MKCPKCGHENRDDAIFCNACGARLTEKAQDLGTQNPAPAADPSVDPSVDPAADPAQNPANYQPTGFYNPPPAPSKFRLALRALIAVLLFIGLMLACQSCVISGYLTSLMMQNGMAAAAANGVGMESLLSADSMNALLSSVYENIAVITLIANLLTLLFICLIFRLRRRNPAQEFALHFVNPIRLAEFAILGSAVNVIVSVVISYLPIPEDIMSSFETLYSGLDGSNLFIEILAVVIAAPVVEEIIFRGIGMTRLGPTFGNAAAVILSAILFGLAHGTPIAVGYAFCVGVVLSLIYLRYRSILPTIVFHVFFNFTSYWLTRLDDRAATVVFGASIILTAVLIVSALVRYPRFDDVVCDAAGRIRVKDPERQAVIDDVRRLRTKSEASAEEMEALRERWNAAGKRK